jgi:hypothetical protein
MGCQTSSPRSPRKCLRWIGYLYCSSISPTSLFGKSIPTWISEGKADKGSKTVIRTSIYQYHSGRDQLDPWTHITHCLDTLRQEIQCSADPTIGGMSRVHECRDFEALKDWTTKHAYTEFLAELP